MPQDAASADTSDSLDRRFRAAFSTLTGALIAIGLVTATGVWFYRLGARDAATVPIIRASVEPAKVQPDDPGGAETPHQDISGYDVVTEVPQASGAVALAPPPPSPPREDVPMGALATADPEPEPVVQSPPPAPSEAVAEAASEPSSDVAEPAEPSDTAPPTEPSSDTAERPEDEPATLSDLAPSASPVAPRRPGDLIARTEAARQAVEQQGQDLLVAAANSPIQIQLAADPDEVFIRAEWDRIFSANNDVLRGRALAVQTTRSGGTLWYRLRVGPFENTARANAVCAALKSRGQDCIVARNR